MGTRVDIPAARKLLVPDFVDIDATGAIWTADQMFAQTKDCGISALKFEDLQVHSLTSKSAAIFYRVLLDAACGDQKVSEDLLETSVWVKRGGKWLTELHTETPVAAQK